MNRPQFSLKALLWLTAIVAAFFGGRAYQKQLDEPEWIYKLRDDVAEDEFVVEIMRLRDGSEWHRMIQGDGSTPQPRMPAKQPTPVPDE